MKKTLLTSAFILAIMGCGNNTAQADSMADTMTANSTAAAEVTDDEDEDFPPPMDVIYSDIAASSNSKEYEGDKFTRYAFVEVMGETMALFQSEQGSSEALFRAVTDKSYELVTYHLGAGSIELYEEGVKLVESCGSGCSTTSYIGKEGDSFRYILSHYVTVGPDGLSDESVDLIGYDDELSEEDGKQAVRDCEKGLGKPLKINYNWQKLK